MAKQSRVALTRLEALEVRRRLRAMAEPRPFRTPKPASPHRLYGVLPPDVRALARQIARRHRRDADLGALFDLAGRLWRSPFHEEKSAAIQMLAALARRLEPEHWTVFRKWIAQCRSAEHCDGIAVDLVGGLVKRDRSWCRVLKHWTLSRNPWERRAAVGGVFLRTRQMGDVEAALAICEPLMQDPSPFVQEAVGRLLGEARRADPRMTQEFLDRWGKRGQKAILDALG